MRTRHSDLERHDVNAAAAYADLQWACNENIGLFLMLSVVKTGGQCVEDVPPLDFDHAAVQSLVVSYDCSRS